jgi:hypothetical protein
MEGLEMTDLRWMKVALVLVVMVFGSGLALAAAAGDDPQPTSDKKVTLQLSDTPVIDAIDRLFQGTGYKYTIEPGVSGRISLGFKDVPFEQAIRDVAEASGLTYRASGGRYVFAPKPKEDIPARTEETEVSVIPDSSEQADEDNPPATPEDGGPVFYGHEYPGLYPGVPPSYHISDTEVIIFSPPGFIFGIRGDYTGAPQVLPPPFLRSPSLQRMLDQMNALRSFPGYPYFGIGRPYGYFFHPW